MTSANRPSEHASDHVEEAHAEIAREGAGHHGCCPAAAVVRRLMPSIMAFTSLVRNAGGSMTTPREMAQPPSDERGRQSRDTAPAARAANVAPEIVPTKPIARIAATTAMRADQRHGAALPRGARRAEERKGHQHERERIERRRDAVVQFGAELPGRSLVRADRRAGGFSSSSIDTFVHGECHGPGARRRRDRSNA